MRKRSAAGSNTTGPASSVGQPDGEPTWFSSTKRAFCSIRWFGALGRRGAGRRSCGSGPATIGASRPSAACPSRRDGGTLDGTCSSMWTPPSGKSRSSTSFATSCVIWAAPSSSSGTAWLPTAAGPCGSGCGGADACTWSTCPATRRNSTPTNTGFCIVNHNRLSEPYL
jgi:hypothetical protein